MALFAQSGQIVYLIQNGDYSENDPRLKELGINSLNTSYDITHLTVHAAQLKNDPIVFCNQNLCFISKNARRFSLQSGKMIIFSFKFCRGVFKQTTLVHFNEELEEKFVAESKKKNEKISVISPKNISKGEKHV